ncbi:phosphatase PAP2 family protein [Phycicoccus sp. 3266]|uniref:phosphatase PAP2 family protein n=1 Tax=Phycicoccus sp. 3266 TaxID=2817751 RepID=UPI00285522D3|nr:phosphatase PAP2 family protein [Phycicoccus sp. 3266]MDR6862077.1 undecaprenyl-diphosphatase [Phycicoccus sp. 3266]
MAETEVRERALHTAGRYAERLGWWTVANWVLVVTALVGLALTAALTTLAEDVYESVVEADGVAVLDQPALDQAVAWRSPGLDRAVTAYTDVGGPIGMPLLTLAAVAVMVWAWRSWTPVVLLVLATAGSLALTIAGKDLVGRARPPRMFAVPPYESSPSFPSGHTLNATVIAAVVVYLLLRKVRRTWVRVGAVVLGVAFMLTMGLSRVFLGHHWLSDVVMGWVLGLAWATVVVTAHRLFLAVRREAARRGAPART